MPLSDQDAQLDLRATSDECYRCGEDTYLVWCGWLRFCSRDCLDAFADEWLAEYEADTPED